MGNIDIEKLRMQENLEILEHIEAIEKILDTKCKRCKNITGCLGCEFSSGEMRGYLEEMKEHFIGTKLETF